MMMMCSHFECRFIAADELMRDGRWKLAMEVYEHKLVRCTAKRKGNGHDLELSRDAAAV